LTAALPAPDVDLQDAGNPPPTHRFVEGTVSGRLGEVQQFDRRPKTGQRHDSNFLSSGERVRDVPNTPVISVLRAEKIEPNPTRAG
jgi:hypothetical protein